MLTSPHVRQRALLWQNGTSLDTPGYLKQAYAKLLRETAETEEKAEARRVAYAPGMMGTEIRKRLETLRSDLSQAHKISFNLVGINYNDGDSVISRLRAEGFEVLGFGSWKGGYDLLADKILAINEHALSTLADELSEMARAGGGGLSECSVEPITRNR